MQYEKLIKKLKERGVLVQTEKFGDGDNEVSVHSFRIPSGALGINLLGQFEGMVKALKETGARVRYEFVHKMHVPEPPAPLSTRTRRVANVAKVEVTV